MNEETKTPVVGSDRRIMLKSSLATLAAFGTGALSVLSARADTAPGGSITDTDILNFALNLEYLEAEYYLLAVNGTGLSADETTGTGQMGTVTGGSAVPFQSDAIRQYATEIANDERDHVDFLRSALGSNAVAQPSIDFTDGFNVLAQAAGLGSTFNPFESEANFLLGAFVFEDVGVTAYHGAAPLIKNKTYLDAAAGILAVEAYHAGIIRLLCHQNGLIKSADKVSKLRNKLSAEVGPPATTDQGIRLHSNGDRTPNLVPADSNSIAFERTPQEVLNIVYAGGTSGNFGFFPNRVNGNIQ
jgi:Ferritin-like domain